MRKTPVKPALARAALLLAALLFALLQTGCFEGG